LAILDFGTGFENAREPSTSISMGRKKSLEAQWWQRSLDIGTGLKISNLQASLGDSDKPKSSRVETPSRAMA
jgi:hypothetical protein